MAGVDDDVESDSRRQRIDQARIQFVIRNLTRSFEITRTDGFIFCVFLIPAVICRLRTMAWKKEEGFVQFKASGLRV